MNIEIRESFGEAAIMVAASRDARIIPGNDTEEARQAAINVTSG
ncbi:hypothetical protein [Amycolatopsis taiwanensis]|uniref:Uncharacterized protein n=1 Tax=Amycolatopsis taiwanensis TaxID=342230 RepID=A0A9W6VIT0_9PSEU|nr:hypothetical protein [Amycolatopsis taiwanensis]GLY68767.1 hypothetical protein Atai01_53860 [Amycolatopsis taiwanensis]